MLFQVPLAMNFTIFFIFIWIIIAVLVILVFAFWIMMLIDCVKRDFKDKLVWILIILFAGVIGAILYYFIVKSPSNKK